MVDSEVREWPSDDDHRGDQTGHGHRRLGTSNFDYSVVTNASCASETYRDQANCIVLGQEGVRDITMLDKVAKFKNQCRYSEYKEWQCQRNHSRIPVQGNRDNTLGDDVLFCMAFDGSVDPSKIVQLFVTAVTILVVAIPEGLPLAVTLALAVAQQKMSQVEQHGEVLGRLRDDG